MFEETILSYRDKFQKSKVDHSKKAFKPYVNRELFHQDVLELDENVQ